MKINLIIFRSAKQLVKCSFFAINLICCGVFLILSCSSGNGTKNPENGFTLKLKLTSGEFSGSDFEVTFPDGGINKISSDLLFVNIHTAAPTFAEIKFDEEKFLIFGSPGDTILLTSDYESLFRENNFKGDKANENNFLTMIRYRRDTKYMENYFEMMKATEDEFLRLAEIVFQSDLNYFQEYQKSNGIFSKEFEDLYHVEMKYNLANLKIEYPEEHRYQINIDSFKLSDTYFSFLQNLKTDVDEKLSSPNYRKFLFNYFNHKAAEKITEDTLSSGVEIAAEKMKLVSKLFHNSKVQSFIYYAVIDNYFEYTYNDAFSVYDYFLDKQENEKLKERIKQRYKEIKHLRPGSSLPEMKLITDKNETINLSDIRGKVIYLDIWAKWCGPCKRQFPYFEKLVQQYKNRDDILFAGISLDEEKDVWIEFIKTKNTSSVQLWDENNWDAVWVNHFKIDYIPRFILIDKKGKIADATALKPSDKNIVDTIERLLND